MESSRRAVLRAAAVGAVGVAGVGVPASADAAARRDPVPALYLASLMAGDQTAQAIQLAVEYDPQPPFDTRQPDKAGPELQRLALQLLADSQV